MKVLFVIYELFFSEPLGAMLLSSICRKAGHKTRLAILREHNLTAVLEEYDPDLIAYSAMTPDEPSFKTADKSVLAWMDRRGRRVPRIMGGPHPTFFPEALENMGLDAICIGDGDNAILLMLEALGSGHDMSGIPNVATQNHPEPVKTITEDLDAFPYADRDLIYSASPGIQRVGIRSFLTRRGCPYKCTYCFNHMYHNMFKGLGKNLIRRRSVSNVLEEIREVVSKYPPVRFIRFADDVFVIQKDDWLEEFAVRYPREIGLPFYCLTRANSLNEEIIKLLSRAGCRSIAMSIEAGDENIRNEIMKRNMPDAVIQNSFDLTRKYGIKTFSNTILGVPGTALADDFKSYLFTKKVRPSAPGFTIFWPFPRTELTNYAERIGVLPRQFDFNDLVYSARSVLNNYTEEEKNIQLRLSILAPIFCKLPGFADPLLRLLVRLPLTGLYMYVGAVFYAYIIGSRCFPGAQPRDPVSIARSIWRSVRYVTKPMSRDKKG